MTVGERIRTARKAVNMTQQDLAALLDVSFTLISQYERGVRTPKFETLTRIADALGVNVSVFYDNETVEEAEKLAQLAHKTKGLNAEAVKESLLHINLLFHDHELIDKAEHVARDIFLDTTSEITEKFLRDELLASFQHLNRIGKFEAVRRVGELREVSQFSDENLIVEAEGYGGTPPTDDSDTQ